MTLSEELEKLAELRASGTLTEEEFARAKERLLNAAPGAPGGAGGAGAPGVAGGAARSSDPVVSALNSFRRSRTDRWFGGVCGGMARSSGMEAWVWRLIFAALFICAGAGLLVYVLLWIFVPAE